jgi:hypothetical protein
MDVFDEIQVRLAAIRRARTEGPLDPFEHVASQTRYARPVRDEKLAAIEERLGVSVPAQYREFLLRIGEEAPGPCYGLLPLGSWFEALDVESESESISLLRGMCPLNTLDSSSDWLETLGGTHWRERMDAGEWHPYQGTLTIAAQGCTFYSVLIVNGEHRGRVVHVDMDLRAPQPSRYTDFIHWYCAWIQSVIAGRDFRDVYNNGTIQPVPLPF